MTVTSTFSLMTDILHHNTSLLWLLCLYSCFNQNESNFFYCSRRLVKSQESEYAWLTKLMRSWRAVICESLTTSGRPCRSWSFFLTYGAQELKRHSCGTSRSVTQNQHRSHTQVTIASPAWSGSGACSGAVPLQHSWLDLLLQAWKPPPPSSPKLLCLLLFHAPLA